jgi:UDP-3-O-[3-hydroxymyristoyl] glucosamine N-acyltransferase
MESNSPVYTLQELAQLTHTQLQGNPELLITGVDDLETATFDKISFLENPKYEQRMQKTQAGAICIHPQVTGQDDRSYLVTETPSLTFQKIIELFVSEPKSGFHSIHPSAVIHPEALLEEGVVVGPHAVIDRGARIGAGSIIGANVFVGAETIIGQECKLYPHSVVREGCILGNRVILQPGAVIGSCGYGYYTLKNGKHISLKQLGNVILEDDVEVGANTTIDRARFKTTRICKGTKIDNLVQIAHQVTIGEDNLIVSQTGIAGSSKTGKNVVLAGQVGVVGHISITDGVILAARSAAIKSIEQSGVYSGAPASPIKDFNEQMVYIRNIKKLADRLSALEKKIEQSHSG